MQLIEEHAGRPVSRGHELLVAGMCETDVAARKVTTAQGQALADEFGLDYMEVDAKTGTNVEEVFLYLARQALAHSRLGWLRDKFFP
ncbi:hypothetical protein WJX73_001192 [Symbiochloris irregularis]|uniref:Uncharacterized protein n=1 Tax=Symbiochloris irregularis TaxID=706552 RepID=A0AAW1PRL2_9CHLO